MRIDELFSGGVEWQWVGKSRALTKATFTVDSGEYGVWFAGDSSDSYNIGFMLIQGERISMNVTGTGNAPTVLATVVSIIKAFIDEVHPDEFHFQSADRVDFQVGVKNSRTVLYDRMSKRLAALVPDYTLSAFRDGGQSHWSFKKKS